MTIKKTPRRRGKELENALLTAAWEEFQEKGYNKMTMEGIAARAHTTKTVLYRRWPKKSVVLIMAFRKFGPEIRMEPTDTGSLRQDLFNLLSGPIKGFKVLGEETIRGLVAEQIGDHISDLFEGMMTPESNFRKRILVILKQAEKRGEVNLSQLSDRAIALPILMYIDEVLTTGFLTDESLKEIIDDILIPVLTKGE
ncbi:TetR/AcrR family transcriptional regulator [Pediococcus ethanolidurans]|uniref:TetR/AcrR family transcriptional regulator n=1 Tax=Pediococcus ethanolidurans TaxID=319653 RepID=UPI001C1F085B|nr:TetR/AcrR family transcriptional regulator [Pediococcus ethanolidurans]MBU7562905.1 TetR/AcrR family transcriptional regulator [Pediococcus ethanolidurans]MCT4398762.1 TetR/AcrR family transcriptional regulator [Pediococcus ethanolidurans]MCV3321948.1 TetR/AcrR family transcriptional regulator [Pediococcus ethanolidurans]